VWSDGCWVGAVLSLAAGYICARLCDVSSGLPEAAVPRRYVYASLAGGWRGAISGWMQEGRRRSFVAGCRPIERLIAELEEAVAGEKERCWRDSLRRKRERSWGRVGVG
jgi:hypothetical protein